VTIEPVAGRQPDEELIDAFKRMHRAAFDRLRDEIRGAAAGRGAETVRTRTNT